VATTEIAAVDGAAAEHSAFSGNGTVKGTVVTDTTVVATSRVLVVMGIVVSAARASVVSGTMAVVTESAVSADEMDCESLHDTASSPKAANAATLQDVRTVSEFVGRSVCDTSGSFRATLLQEVSSLRRVPVSFCEQLQFDRDQPSPTGSPRQ
jgi:hypothetical protein